MHGQTLLKMILINKTLMVCKINENGRNAPVPEVIEEQCWLADIKLASVRR